jgi:predicted transglutaminase-like cysteine proteinase
MTLLENFLPTALLIVLCAAPAYAAGAGESPAGNGWTAETTERPAPGELRLQGYRVLPAREAEAKALGARWGRIMREHDPECFFNPHPDFDKELLKQWQNLVAKLPGLSIEEALRYVNGFFNRLPSKKDIDTYREEEYWATPEEFVRNKGGDCEDYAVVKYMTLRRFRVPAENMWLLLVYDRNRKDYHAVLAVNTGERLFMLDNLSRPSYLLVPSPVFLKSFTPLFAVNEKGVWACVPEDK